jgi:hypothetical protein
VDDSDVVVEGYTEYTYNVGPVSGSSNTLELTFGNGLGEFLLDDVSVVDNGPVVTPEPDSLLLFGTGLLALVGVARRRFSSR